MTTRQALEILIQYAGENFKGSGCGLRHVPIESERKKVLQAITKIWPKAYDYPLTKDKILQLMGFE